MGSPCRTIFCDAYTKINMAPTLGIGRLSTGWLGLSSQAANFQWTRALAQLAWWQKAAIHTLSQEQSEVLEMKFSGWHSSSCCSERKSHKQLERVSFRATLTVESPPLGVGYGATALGGCSSKLGRETVSRKLNKLNNWSNDDNDGNDNDNDIRLNECVI